MMRSFLWLQDHFGSITTDMTVSVYTTTSRAKTDACNNALTLGILTFKREKSQRISKEDGILAGT